jgi:hypothetical protein
MSFSRAYAARLAYVDPFIYLDAGWLSRLDDHEGQSSSFCYRLSLGCLYAFIAFQESRNLG